MSLRTDHVAGAALVVFGVLIIALSGDLPAGQLSMPGSGFLPMLIAGLIILLGAALVLRGRESEPFANIDWEDLKHAGPIVLITAAATVAYTWLGFTITMILLMLILLLFIERRPVLHALAYGVGVVVLTYGVFTYLLNAPLPTGPLGF